MSYIRVARGAGSAIDHSPRRMFTNYHSKCRRADKTHTHSVETHLPSVNQRIRPPLPPEWPFPPGRDVTGRTFGDLVALQYLGADMWLWRCRCGSHVTAGLDAVES